MKDKDSPRVRITANGGEADRVIEILEREGFRAELATGAEDFDRGRQFLELMARATNDAVYEWEFASDRIWWSEGFQALFGRSPRGQSLESWRREVHPDDRDDVMASLREAITEGRDRWSAEYRFRRADGGYAYVLERGFVLRDEADQPVRMVGCLMDLTHRREAEEALRRSEARFRELAENVQEVFFHMEVADRRLVYLSPHYARVWQRDPAELADRPLAWLRAVSRGDRAAVVDAFRQGLAGRKVAVDFRILRPDGAERWVRGAVYPIHAADGSLLRIVGTARDITERKTAVLELARTNRALEMLGACNEVLIRNDDETHLLAEICRVAVEIGGYRMAWVGYACHDAGRTIVPMAHAGAEGGYLSEIHLTWSDGDIRGQGPGGRTIRSGRPVVCGDIRVESERFAWREAALRRGFRGLICLPLREGAETIGMLALYSGGTLSPGDEELRLLQKLADNLAFGIGHLRSERERRRMEVAIRQQASLLDTARDAILVRALDHRITYWNKSAERLYGWNRDEALGRSIETLLYRDPEPFRTATAQVVTDGGWVGELRQFAKDGRELVVECRWTLVRDDDGEPASILAINTDVTAHKELERQLLRAQRMESIGTLAGGIAHDLNNILAPISMSIELLRMRFSDERSAGLLETIDQSARRGAAMVGQVLSFARGMEGRRIEFDPAEPLEAVARIARDTFPKNIAIHTLVEPGLPAVEGDPTQIHQVLLNFCVNARDAIPAAGGSITLAAETAGTRDAEAQVRLAVRDTGCGMPPELVEKIFDPFFTTKSIGEGTGLGLSTALAIAKGHRGRIEVDSAPGRGSTFSLLIPALRRGAPAAERPEPDSPSPGGGGGETVLLVDDEAAVREVARQALETFGYRVLSAADGAEALAVHERHAEEIALVLTDMTMPVMDGATLVAQLAKRAPHLPVIVTSGVGAAGAEFPSVRAFLPKPASAAALIGAVREALSHTG